jgi:hypothetical protein
MNQILGSHHYFSLIGYDMSRISDLEHKKELKQPFTIQSLIGTKWVSSILLNSDILHITCMNILTL